MDPIIIGSLQSEHPYVQSPNLAVAAVLPYVITSASVGYLSERR